MSSVPGSIPGARRTSSARSSRTISSVESSVTKLLMSTKHLLQKLTQWSKSQASEKSVSDAYVQLGNDFKIVSKQFLHSGLDVSDLGDVPLDLRRVLEVALRESPSEETLDKYLPRIREIIVTLLDKLKVKQAMLKGLKLDQRKASTSNVSSTSSLGQNPAPLEQSRSKESDIIPVVPSASSERKPAATSTPTKSQNNHQLSVPKQRNETNDALMQLKKGNTLQRRASKRFSAYHMAKLAGQFPSDARTPVIDDTETFETDILPKIPSISNNPNTSISSESSKLDASKSHDTEIVLYLKLQGRVKKCLVTLPLTFNSLRLLFVEKFTYSPGTEVFPDIYIQDPGEQIPYELEESHLPYIQEKSIIQLHSESSNADISNQAVLQAFEKLKDDLTTRNSAIISQIRNLQLSGSSTNVQKSFNSTDFRSSEELHDIKHELSVLYQLQRTNRKSLEENISSILEKIKTFKSLSFHSSTTANRTYMEKSHTKLSEISDALLSKVDDLQDIIEALRKDVAERGSKPTKKKLETLSTELQDALTDLSKMEDYITIEKPNWKKIWESELDKVCEEQQFLTLQEDLAFDFKQDLDKVLETFELVKLCCEEQEKNPKKNRSNPIIPLAKPGTFGQIRDAVLMEVESLNPDHDGRLEAIERAEKLRQKERDYKDSDEFEEELGSFVENGSFKKAGGIEEIERIRKQKDEDNMRATFGIN
ncbi:LAFE_0D02520g1_1 [Lachancea fermentati]|uniref:LAFE_0D02520g1_1 n=1 Tax=Lachancea fermentati TaxID=4955 RepID=A0A1G4MB13_LACFM|nr:LAFE_0D02520g1_1 [Lachancea fermentati]